MRNLTAKHIAANLPDRGLSLNTYPSPSPYISSFNNKTITLPVSYMLRVKYSSAATNFALGRASAGNASQTGITLASFSGLSFYASLISQGYIVNPPYNFNSAGNIDGRHHNLVMVCQSAGGSVKIYSDGVLKNSAANANITVVTFNGGTAEAFVLRANGGMVVSQLGLVNFDMSAAGAPYSIADYQNGRDIPTPLLTATSGDRFLLALRNNLGGTTWADDSAAASHMTLAGSYNIIDAED